MQGKIASVELNANLLFQDKHRAVVILLLIYLEYNIQMDQNTASKIGWLLCLPKLSKNEFNSYWDVFLQPLQVEWYVFELNG